MTGSALNIAREVRETRAALAAVGSADRAVNQRAYLKSELVFLGADMPAIRRIAKGLIARVRTADEASMRPLIVALWGTGVHELRAHRADVSGLTMREGAKYLPARDRRALLGS